MSDTPMAETLVQRLRGIYAVGKGDPPEFGFRQFDNLPAIQSEAANRIEELERENADLRSDIERHVKIASEQATELVELRAKLEAAQRDAERYRWLREPTPRASVVMDGGAYRETLDDEIDAAIRRGD